MKLEELEEAHWHQALGRETEEEEEEEEEEQEEKEERRLQRET